MIKPELSLKISRELDLVNQRIQLIENLFQDKQSKAFLQRDAESMVPEELSSNNMFHLDQACSTSSFILVRGVEFSGKTTLVKEYIKAKKISKFITIYVTQTLDIKGLIGNYICSEKIGEFEWRDGPLCAAYKHGYTLVLENLDEGKEEVFELFTTALEQRLKIKELDGYQAHRKFKVIGLWRDRADDTLVNVDEYLYSKPYMSSILINPITQDCISQKVKEQPILDELSKRLFTLTEEIKPFLKEDHCYSPDLLKFGRLCNRLCYHYAQVYGDKETAHFSLTSKMMFVQDFLEVYLAGLRSGDLSEKIWALIGEAFALAPLEIRVFLDNYETSIGLEGSMLTTKRYPSTSFTNIKINQSSKGFIETKHSKNLVERIYGSLGMDENLLLVGETGCGKTTSVQETAKLLGKQLYVYNMSQSSDVSDLLGGFKPIDAKSYIEDFVEKFRAVLDSEGKLEDNKKVIVFLRRLLSKDDVLKALTCLIKYTEEMKSTIQTPKGKKRLSSLQRKLRVAYNMKDKLLSKLVFKYLKANLVKALKAGDWVLLDEINLAEGETLNKLAPLLEGDSFCLIDKGELREVSRHPDFRLIGCMNPGNAVGKKELPDGIRKRFTEMYVEELEDEIELTKIAIRRSQLHLSHSEAEKIVGIYLKLRALSLSHEIEDGFGRKPNFTLRTLCRAIDISKNSKLYYPAFKERAIYEAVFGAFGSNLNLRSQARLEEVVEKEFNLTLAGYDKVLRSCKGTQFDGATNIKGFHIKKGQVAPKQSEELKFLLTETVEKTLIGLMRIVSLSDFPVLLEGPTSAGKTSMIKFMAAMSGNRVVRINNHQHTDLDEYIGTYSPDESGRLVFKKGLLVEAMIRGDWLILDELNLAKSEILEALNRLLDDNRELYIPEINKTLTPHPDFRIFATQNPISYGGRKELSAAFRNRFIHFYFQELKKEDLIEIVDNRCDIPRSRAEKLVQIMDELKTIRTRQNMFAGKESLITIRDLLKIAERDIVDYDKMAIEANSVLVERLRHDEERELVREVISKICVKSKPLELAQFYQQYIDQHIPQRLELFNDIFWNENFKRMFVLVHKCALLGEPSLLIGETGCGKTTAAEMIAKLRNVKLYSVNCHQYTESSDFIGSLRPLRNREGAIDALNELLSTLIKQEESEEMANEKLILLLKHAMEGTIAHNEDLVIKCVELGLGAENSGRLEEAIKKVEQIFEWVDGPLVTCMKEGGVLLIDEISLAQDSVLERLNSVLEKEKTLVLAEKGDGEVTELTAHQDFIIIATMNPSGDFGKKELTPALRNRFTEIWVKPITDAETLEKQSSELMDSTLSLETIISTPPQNDLWEFLYSEVLRLLSSEHSEKIAGLSKEQIICILSCCIFRIVYNFNLNYGKKLKPLTLRDIKSTLKYLSHNFVEFSFDRLHGYLWLLLGGFYCINKEIAKQVHLDSIRIINLTVDQFVGVSPHLTYEQKKADLVETDSSIGEGSYNIKKLKEGIFSDSKYSITQKTVAVNLKRIISSFFVDKAILLEGPPGVGKTSLIEILSKKIGIPLYRINLSEQTDLIDLLGSDIPTDSSSLFTWADGVLLKAMKEGAWLLLDELNMASQTVLEGLNSILDHRGSIYLPELDRVIEKKEGFRIFASQNPTSMGSGRKGLPHSFLTRFTRIWLEAYDEVDLREVIESVYKEDLLHQEVQQLIDFFFEIKQAFGNIEQNGWEFNLRDLHIIFDMIEEEKRLGTGVKESISRICKIVIFNRMNNTEQILLGRKIFRKCFGFDIEVELQDLMDSTKHSKKLLSIDTLENISILLSEPILKDLKLVANLEYPVLFVTNSETESLIRVEDIVHSLAVETGRNLRIISLFSSSDVVDIVGSFEQVTFQNKLAQLSELLLEEISSKVNQALKQDQLETLGILLTLDSTQAATHGVDLVDRLHTFDEFNLSSIQGLKQLFEGVANETAMGHNIFTWIESEMVKCIKDGSWVYIKGVESVNPAILERLNAIMEKNKIVFLNEVLTGSKDDKELTKHPNFKIFLKYDESKAKSRPSRALRNRCIELRVQNFIPTNQEALEDIKYSTSEQHYSELINRVFQGINKKDLLLENFVGYERLWSTLKHICSLEGVKVSKAIQSIKEELIRCKSSIGRKIHASCCVERIEEAYLTGKYSDIQNEEQGFSPFSLVTKQMLINKHTETVVGRLVEVLMKQSPHDYYSYNFSDFKTALFRSLIELIEESILEKYTDDFERIRLSSEDSILALYLMVKSLTGLKYSFKTQLTHLLDIFFAKQSDKLHSEEILLREHAGCSFIKGPEEFLINCLMMSMASNGFIFSKFMVQEKERKDENASILSIRRLISEEAYMKLSLIRNGPLKPAALDLDNLLKLSSYFANEKLTDFSNISSIVEFLESTISSNYEKAREMFLSGFLIFEYQDEYRDETDTYDKALFISGGDSSSVICQVVARIEALDSLSDDRDIKLCIDLVQEEFEFSVTISKMVNEIREGLRMNRNDTYEKLLRQYRPGQNLDAIKQSIDSADLRKHLGLLSRFERMKKKEIKINEIEFIKSNIKILESCDQMIDNLQVPLIQVKSECVQDFEEIDKLIEIIKKEHLPLLKRPDMKTQDLAVEAFRDLTSSEVELVSTRIQQVEEGVFRSLISRETVQKLSQINEALRTISKTMHSKKIRTISLGDLAALKCEQDNINSIEGDFLSQRIATILQGSFFSSGTVISQGIIDSVIQIVNEDSILKKSPTHEGQEQITSLISMIAEQSVHSGDLLVFNDIIVPLLTDLTDLLTLYKSHVPAFSFSPLSHLRDLISSQLCPTQPSVSLPSASAANAPLTSIPSSLSPLLSLLSLRGLLSPYLSSRAHSLQYLSASLAKKASIARGKNLDGASRLINLQKGVEKLVVNEYTKEAVEEGKKKERKEICKVFGKEDKDWEEEGGRARETEEEKEREGIRKIRIEFLREIYEMDLEGVFENGVRGEKEKEACLVALINLGIPEINNAILDTKGLLKLTKKRMAATLSELKTSNIIEMKDLSVFTRIDSLRCTADLADIWREQIMQLIEVDKHGFYKGVDKEELSQAQFVCGSLVKRLKELRGNFEVGDLPILTIIVNSINTYLSAELEKTPLNKAASYLEKIITDIIDFETIVPMKYHFKEKTELTEILARWRKRERRTWRTMLSIQNLDEILEDVDTCNMFKDAMFCSMQRGRIHKKDVLSLVENFLRTAKHFTFINRLCWLDLVLRQIRKSFPGKKYFEILQLIQGIWAYYSNFVRFSLERYKEMFSGIDTPIKEIEKLSNWHMEDFVNLKLNIEKYHRGINRTMNSHKEILDQKASISVIDAKRALYLHKDEDAITTRLVKEGFVYEGELPIYEEEVEEAPKEHDIVQKTLDTADKRAGLYEEKVQEKKVLEIQRRVIKTINKQTIDSFFEKFEKTDLGRCVEKKVMNLFVKDLRIVKPAEWMGLLLGQKQSSKSELQYKDYKNGCDLIEEEIDDWFSQLVALKEVKNRAARERGLMIFLKSLKAQNYSLSHKIANFEVENLLTNIKIAKPSGCLEGTGLEEAYSKIYTRIYDVIDMLIVQRYDGKYREDLEPVYRDRMQGASISILYRTSKRLGKTVNALEIVKKINVNFEEKSKISSKIKNIILVRKFIKDNLEMVEIQDIVSEHFVRAKNDQASCVKVLQKLDQGIIDLNTAKEQIGKLTISPECEDLISQLVELTGEEISELEENIALQIKRFILSFSELMAKYDAEIEAEGHLKGEKLFLSLSTSFLSRMSSYISSLGYIPAQSPPSFAPQLLILLSSLISSHLTSSLTSLTRYLYLTTKIFHNLIYKGFCSTEAAPEPEQGDEEEYDYGTGIGEGKGDENANENYEFEEQLLGEQDKNDPRENGDKNESEDDEIGQQDDDKAMDMENDFDGQNGDKGEDEKDKQEIEDAFDNVDNADMERKLWDEENQEMDEEDKEDNDKEEDDKKSLRDDDEVDFEGQQKEEQTETKAKEFDDKQTRDAKDDFQDQQDQDENGEDDQEGKVEEKEMEEAEVEELSSMSERGERDDMDFDENQEQEEDDPNQQPQSGEEDNEDFGDLDENVDDDDFASNEEDQFEDPLDKEERKFEEDIPEEPEHEDALSEKGAAQNDLAEEEDNNKMQEEEKGANQGGANNKEEEDKKEGQEEEEKEMRQEAEDDENTPEQHKKDMKLDKQRMEELMENVTFLANQDKPEQQELDMENFDAIEEAGDDEEGTFKVTAPSGMNMDSKKEDKEKEANPEEKPIMKLKEDARRETQVKNEQENAKEENPADKEILEDNPENQDNEEENSLGKRSEIDEQDLEDQPNPEKVLKRDETQLILDEEYSKDMLVELMKQIVASNEDSTSNKHVLWMDLEEKLQDSALYLSEELRHIFKPTKIAGMKGDYRTGKRLNMRKVISYVASNYRKDMIWLRRSEPTQKEYQIILAIDDSLSMT